VLSGIDRSPWRGSLFLLNIEETKTSRAGVSIQKCCSNASVGGSSEDKKRGGGNRLKGELDGPDQRYWGPFQGEGHIELPSSFFRAGRGKEKFRWGKERFSPEVMKTNKSDENIGGGKRIIFRRTACLLFKYVNSEITRGVRRKKAA